MLTIGEIQKILDAKIVCGGADLDGKINTACGSDMMSDVLAFVKDQSCLLTGMVNPQVIRTADMMDMHCIIFVRGKVPDEAMIELAEERGITLMTTDHRMFNACGLLWENGLRGGN